MTWWAIGIGAVSLVTSVVGQQKAGKDAQRSLDYQAAQYNQNAGQTQAAAQRIAENQRRDARLLTSRAQAIAGGGAGDVSVVKTISDISAEGELRALSALYEGDSSAQEMRDRAKAKVFEGGQARTAANLASAGTVFQGGSQLYSKYSGRPNTTQQAGGYNELGYLEANR
jgi:hypothetical protein